MNLSIIGPVYDEEQTISEIIRQILAVACDGSRACAAGGAAPSGATRHG